MSDRAYSASRDGAYVSVPKIDDLCLALKDKFLRQEETIERLQEENQKLKNGIWEKEEIAKLKSDYNNMLDEWRRGFPISKDEWDKIKEWQKKYTEPLKETKIGAIGGMFTYKFYPTSIGVSGVCIAPNGDEFEFQTIG